MFEEIWKDGLLLGHCYPLKRGFAFFGTRHFGKADFKNHFPQFEFQTLKQIHSARVIESPPTPLEADGHWTIQQNLALVIQTADCVPLMIETPKRIIALHAGWRGVEQNILGAALASLRGNEIQKSHFVAGPHIATSSFEVGTDVAERLLNSDPQKDSSAILPHAHSDKRYVDIQRILRHQAQAYLKETQIHFLNIDTVKSAEHHSFRRNGPNAGRLYSFIVSEN